MKRKTVALYDPYLDTLGGGERHALSIMQVLNEEGYQPVIFWGEDFNEAISKKLHIRFKDKILFKNNIFADPSYSAVKKLQHLSQYDIFIYMTDGSYFFSSAKKNYIFALVPNKELFKMNPLNKLKTMNTHFLTNSHFSQYHLKKWGISAQVLYPYLDNTLIQQDTSALKKESTILSVGRFFKQLHTKRHDVMIEYFSKLQNDIPEFNTYKLVLAGGLKEEDKEYFEELKKMIKGNPSITLEPNISYQSLLELYKRSRIYWHFAGFGVDENDDPQLTEHLGISPLEAMAFGCTPFCYKAGGLKETIIDNETGYLFTSYEELKQKLQNYLSQKNQTTISENAKQYIKKTFSYDIFKEQVQSIFLEK